MYGKLFAQMYDGTLGTRGPWEALVTFQQLIILADKQGGVDMTAEAIARRTTIPLEVIKRGLTALQKADPQSRTPDEDGRRIVPLADNRTWGWRIVNYDKYRKIRTADERREYLRQYQRDRRAKLNVARKQNVNMSTADNHKQPIAVSSIAEVEAKLRAHTVDGLSADAQTAYATYPHSAGMDTVLEREAAKRSWGEVSQCVVEMGATAAKWTPYVFRAFLAKVPAPPRAPKAITGPAPSAGWCEHCDGPVMRENSTGRLTPHHTEGCPNA